MKMDEMHI